LRDKEAPDGKPVSNHHLKFDSFKRFRKIFTLRYSNGPKISCLFEKGTIGKLLVKFNSSFSNSKY